MGITHFGYVVTCDGCEEEAPGSGWRNLEQIKQYARKQDNWRFGKDVLCGWCYDNRNNSETTTEEVN